MGQDWCVRHSGPHIQSEVTNNLTHWVGNGACVIPCQADRVMTKEGSCVVAMIRASTQIEILEIDLYKYVWFHICMQLFSHAVGSHGRGSRVTTGLQVPNTMLPSIEVTPNANFALNVSAELRIEPTASAVDTPWVLLGSLEKRLGYSLLVSLYLIWCC